MRIPQAMEIADFVVALKEAIHPRFKCNRRRIHHRWACRLLAIISAVSARIRSIQVGCHRLVRMFVPPPELRSRHAKRMRRARSIAITVHKPGVRRNPRRQERVVKAHKKQIIRIDDTHLMRVDISMLS